MSDAMLQRAEPSEFEPDIRFALDRRIEATPYLPKEQGPDDYARGFADGAEQARRECTEELERCRAEARRIEEAIVRLGKDDARDLERRMLACIVALCEHAVTPLAIDPEGLARRVKAMVAMLARAQDEKRVECHPDDLASIRERIAAEIELLPNPSLERGALRVVTPEGGIEDGPASWRAMLDEVLGGC